MFCTACGKEIPDDSIFCQNCGLRVSTAVDLWSIPVDPTAAAAAQGEGSSPAPAIAPPAPPVPPPAYAPAPLAVPSPAVAPPPVPVAQLPVDKWELSAAPVFEAAAAPDSEPDPFAADVPPAKPTEWEQSAGVGERPSSGLPLMGPVDEDEGQPFDWGSEGAGGSDRWHYLRWVLIGLVVVIVAAAAATAFLMLRDGNGASTSGTTVTTKVATSSTGATSAAGAASTTASSATSSTQSDSTGTTGTTAAQAISTAQTGGGSLVDLSAKATLRASSTLDSSGGTDYAVANLVDDAPDTSWAEGVKGYGRGEWFEFAFTTPVAVTQIQLIPGYDSKSGGTDLWTAYGRLKTFNLDFSDGAHKECTVKDSTTMQTITLASPHTVTKVRVTVTDVYPATTAKNSAQITAVSEFHVWGTE